MEVNSLERVVMKRDELLHRQQQILNRLSRLPRKILLMQGKDNVTEFVLHELCNEDCFNLEKAAYLIDNPDFNCLKGIAGFSRKEAYNQNLWDNPQAFSTHMQASSFNKKVRSFLQESFRKQSKPETDVVKHIARDLDVQNYGFLSWNMKHDNHGLFIYQKAYNDDTCTDDYILDGLCLLGFCPIF